ncbi:GNAT family N-acetyltransferase [Arthrobacter sp. MSA 4-2]|uniref:GNAT family N-acetyltransferase n=1 Tax=Arthrobacter sp. MSA 4-2 TaxID=2794349 RepID=UPI0018E715E3|nr:GNAT family protein [Arthrobacter sp. MSA 4-2]MBJ2122045.1 GNAT family N-acetyltransferase [Arthrobacter sp. MSA 4-2]
MTGTAGTRLAEFWPLFGLSISTPRLVLTPVRDDQLPGLVDAILAGIHDPSVMPFSPAWTDAPRDTLIRESLKYHWGLRAAVSPESWTISFAVQHEGRIIGVQDLSARSFALLRRVSTGSWLTLDAQGRGLGKEMRSAVLSFAFDHLGAHSAVSDAAVWNAASLGVSAALGYQPNGTTLTEARPGEVREQQLLLLTREDFRRPEWTAAVEGVDAVRPILAGA